MTRIDSRFDAIERRFDRLEDEMRGGFDAVRVELQHNTRLLAQIGWGMLGLLVVQFIVGLLALS